MFWDNFIKLCNQINKSPTSVISDLGISRGSVTHWKSGKVPHHDTLLKIANHFGVTVDYLLGKTDVPNSPETATTPTDTLSPHETEVIKAYRAQPDMQPAVDKILGVIEDGYILLYDAAQSENNRPPRITKMTVERWEALKNAPETDDDLL